MVIIKAINAKLKSIKSVLEQSSSMENELSPSGLTFPDGQSLQAPSN
jgi:hypothetical protein